VSLELKRIFYNININTMGFFDIKLLLILLLTIIIYIMFREITTIKSQINYLFAINKEPKKNIIIDNQYPYNNTIIQPVNNIITDEDPYTDFNEFDDLNFDDIATNINMPESLFNNFIIKTIHLPLNNINDFVFQNYKVENYKPYNENVIALNDYNVVELDNIDDLDNINNLDIVDDNNNVVINLNNNFDNMDIDLNNNNVIISNKEFDNMTEKTDNTHIEVYSNDNTITISPTKNENNTTNNNNNNNISILKDLTKYKLPELQDLAIEYKIALQINNKKKNKNDLIKDIKSYISNKK